MMKKYFLYLILPLLVLIIISTKDVKKIELTIPTSITDLGYSNDDIERLVYYYTTDVLDIIEEYQIPSYFTKACLKYKNCHGMSLGKYYEKARGSTHNLLYTINTINRPNLLEVKNTKSKAILPDTKLILVNKNYYLERDFTPKNLTKISVIPHIIRPNEEMLADLEAFEHYLNLYQKAKDKGLSLVVYSAYRTYEKQEILYYSINNQDDNYVARPGFSEHHTGLAFDISTLEVGLTERFEMTPEFTFLKNNAHTEGFILRYPKGKEGITGYFYEPWHFRYVGKKAAFTIYYEGLTLEEYLARYIEIPPID
ncbi:MAG: M15 family metallopeptidase [Bacilli bacterium]|jgi:D-alanyl-D-alanine carboxypeptidase